MGVISWIQSGTMYLKFKGIQYIIFCEKVKLFNYFTEKCILIYIGRRALISLNNVFSLL